LEKEKYAEERDVAVRKVRLVKTVLQELLDEITVGCFEMSVIVC
jgi:hypothetical protein